MLPPKVKPYLLVLVAAEGGATVSFSEFGPVTAVAGHKGKLLSIRSGAALKKIVSTAGFAIESFRSKALNSDSFIEFSFHKGIARLERNLQFDVLGAGVYFALVTELSWL